MTEENNKNENKFGEKETAEDVVENLKEIKELGEKMEERRKKEKERVLQAGQRKTEEDKRKEYSFRKDPSKLFKRSKLKHFVSGRKGEKQMMNALGGIKGIKSKQGEEFARGLKKFADESVKVPTKPTTLKKIAMINYLKELKKEKYGPLKRSQIRKIRETFFPGIKQKRIFTRNKDGGTADSQSGTDKKFSVSRRVDKSFDDRGGVGRRR